MTTVPVNPAEAREQAFAEEVTRLARSGGAGLVPLCDERHSAYQAQPAAAVVRMRTWVLLALPREPLPPEALPFVLEELETAMDPYPLAAAAVCLRGYAQADPAFVEPLRRALGEARGRDWPVSLDQYGGLDGDPARATSPLREVVAAIAWLGPLAAPLAGDLQEIVTLRSASSRILPEIERIAASLPREAPDCCSALPPALRGWLRLEKSSAARELGGVILEDQAGVRRSYREHFHGRPAIVAFFYTRCDNAYKCTLTISKLARVQALLAERGLWQAIRTAAVTYDPDYDTPERLTKYGRNRRLRMEDGHGLVRAAEGHQALQRHFELGVSVFESLVARHRIEVFLLDAEGRIAASFTRLAWREADVVDAAAALLAPRRSIGSLWGLAAALVPKCPVCWASYLSAFGVTGAWANPAAGTLKLLAAALLLIHLTLVGWQVRRHGWNAAAALSALGACAVAAFWWTGNATWMPLGVAAMAAAAVLQVTRTRVAGATSGTD